MHFTSHHLLRMLAALFLLTCACISTTSCSTSQPAVDRNLFAIDPGKPSSTTPTIPAALRVRRLEVLNPYSGTAFVYQIKGGAFRTDFYNAFVAAPSDLLTASLIDWLSRANCFTTVVDASSTVPTRYSLEGSVTALYGDYTQPTAPQAVVAMRLFILDEQSRGRLVFQKEYRASAPIAPASAPSLVKGWSDALRTILQQIQVDITTRLMH